MSWKDELENLKDDEGYSDRPYTDTLGHATQGYGTLLPLTEQDWSDLLIARWQRMMDDLVSRFEGHLKIAWDHCDDEARRIISNMCYQLGPGRLMRFRKMWTAFEEFDWSRVAAEMRDSRWYKQTTNRAERLAKRMESLR